MDIRDLLGELRYNIQEMQNRGDEVWYRLCHPGTKTLHRLVSDDGYAVYVIESKTRLVALKAKKPHIRTNINNVHDWTIFAEEENIK